MLVEEIPTYRLTDVADAPSRPVVEIWGVRPTFDSDYPPELDSAILHGPEARVMAAAGRRSLVKGLRSASSEDR